MWKRRFGRFVLVATMLAMLGPMGGFGQSPDRFEVVVIRSSPVPADSGTSFEQFEGGRIEMRNEPATLLLRIALQAQNYQLVGGPKWLETERFNIQAKTGRPEKPQPPELTPLMLHLLEDRFHFEFHRETREQSTLALTVVKGGPKLQPKVEGEESAMISHSGQGSVALTAKATSMALLASFVANRLGRVVVDKTGLTGAYDFNLQWAPDQAADSTLPPLITALKEQLGLHLESQKSPVDVFVIDRLERPAGN